MRKISKIWKWIKNTFTSLIKSAKEQVEKYVTPSIMVVEKLKDFVNSPVVPLINGLIPGTVDDVIAAKLRQVLPYVLTTLQVSKECAGKATNDELLRCVISHVKGLTPKAQHAFYLSLAAMLSEALSDDKLTWEEAIIMVQFIYTEQFKK